MDTFKHPFLPSSSSIEAETFDPATGLPTQPLLHEEFKYFLEVAQTNFKVACKRKLDQITYYELTESQAILSFDNYF